MGDFYQKLNPVTGKVEWHVQDESYDYNQEIARSAYADMLHDTDRNSKYYAALRSVIADRKSRNEPTHVLDIGTGTGLLSMMAVTCGADSVTACEGFQPMVKCAKQLMSDNGFAEDIHLIGKRSDEIIVGPYKDMPKKANVLVTEVFDTELIGEGALPTFIHAHEKLLETGCTVIPSEATVYVQLVESQFVRSWQELRPVVIPGVEDIHVPEYISECSGPPSAHDVQLSQVFPHSFQALTTPIPVLNFDFSGKTTLKDHNQSTQEVEITTSGMVHAILMWWTLKMDPEGKIIVSCAPEWTFSNRKQAQWRDHWIQAIYYPTFPITVCKGDSVKLRSYHNEYNMWFRVDNNEDSELENDLGPICTCGAHMVLSRTRIGMLNDLQRHSRYLTSLKQLITSDSICLCLDDASFLPLIAAKLGAKKVYTTQPRASCRQVINSYVTTNKLQDQVKVLDITPLDLTSKHLNYEKVDLILCEPFFLSSLLPWDNIHMWYLYTSLKPHLSPSCKIMPSSGTLKLVAVEFEHLWKTRACLGTVEGFNMEAFDLVISEASEVTDSLVEPQPLWEYPGKALSKPLEVLRFDFTKDIPEKLLCKTGSLGLSDSGHCNGIALWMDWNLDEDVTISTGPVEQVVVGKNIVWDPYTRQGVYFLGKESKAVAEGSASLKFTIKFDPETGSFDFEFGLHEK